MRSVAAIVLVFILAVSGQAVSGQAAGSVADLSVSAPGMTTRAVGSGVLASLPSATVAVTGHGGTVRYAGPRLWDVLARVGATGGAPDDRLHETLTVRGADGYAAPLALAEIDPAFEGKDVILARTRDGAPLARPRLVVPGDRHPGRDVRDVIAITLGAGGR